MAKRQNPQLAELFKTPQRKTYTTVAVTAVLVGVFVFFGIRPAFTQIRELSEELEEKRELRDRIDSKLQTLNRLISDKREVEDELPYFYSALPTEKKTGFVVANLAAIAERNNLELSNVELDEEIDEEDLLLDLDDEEVIRGINLRIALKGELVDFEPFIEYLESFPRIFDVASVSIQTEKSNQTDSEYPYSCYIAMFIHYWGGPVIEEESSE